MTVEKGGNTNKVVTIAIQVVAIVVTLTVATLLPLSGWLARTTISNQSDIASIKNTLYTASDALRDQHQFRADLANIKDLIIAVDRKIPDKIPPTWFEKRVEKIEAEMEVLKKKIP